MFWLNHTLISLHCGNTSSQVFNLLFPPLTRHTREHSSPSPTRALVKARDSAERQARAVSMEYLIFKSQRSFLLSRCDRFWRSFVYLYFLTQVGSSFPFLLFSDCDSLDKLLDILFVVSGPDIKPQGACLPAHLGKEDGRSLILDIEGHFGHRASAAPGQLVHFSHRDLVILNELDAHFLHGSKSKTSTSRHANAAVYGTFLKPQGAQHQSTFFTPSAILPGFEIHPKSYSYGLAFTSQPDSPLAIQLRSWPPYMEQRGLNLTNIWRSLLWYPILYQMWMLRSCHLLTLRGI